MHRPVVLLAMLAAAPCGAHTRLRCPPPLSGAMGQKNGPCDVTADNLSVHAYPLVPGLNTITYEQSIGHPGAPARLALSGEMHGKALSTVSFEQCVLLDHIPHNQAMPDYASNTGAYAKYAITVWIPDVHCKRCFLQLITTMTDQLHGQPENTTCAYAAAKAAGKASASLPDCGQSYHSCAPVSISGTGAMRDDYTCDNAAFNTELGWPFQASLSAAHSGAYPGGKHPSTYFYRGDPGQWNSSTFRVVSQGTAITLDECSSLLHCDAADQNPTTTTAASDAKYNENVGYCKGDAGHSDAWACSDAGVPCCNPASGATGAGCPTAPSPPPKKEPEPESDNTWIILLVLGLFAVPCAYAAYVKQARAAAKVHGAPAAVAIDNTAKAEITVLAEQVGKAGGAPAPAGAVVTVAPVGAVEGGGAAAGAAEGSSAVAEKEAQENAVAATGA